MKLAKRTLAHGTLRNRLAAIFNDNVRSTYSSHELQTHHQIIEPEPNVPKNLIQPQA